MSDDSNQIVTYLRRNPRVMGALLTLTPLLSQTGSAAVGSTGIIYGPQLREEFVIPVNGVVVDNQNLFQREEVSQFPSRQVNLRERLRREEVLGVPQQIRDYRRTQPAP